MLLYFSTKDEDKKEVERQKNWTNAESEWLAQAWIDVSEDSKTGADQSGETFWNRIHSKYEVLRTAGGEATVRCALLTCFPPVCWYLSLALFGRTAKGLKNRWTNAVNKLCTKFHGYFSQLLVGT